LEKRDKVNEGSEKYNDLTKHRVWEIKRKVKEAICRKRNQFNPNKIKPDELVSATISEFKMAIGEVRGTDNRTIKKWFQILKLYDCIKELPDGWVDIE
jgi:hypothetical protein